jgi:hypothetical protein
LHDFSDAVKGGDEGVPDIGVTVEGLLHALQLVVEEVEEIAGVHSSDLVPEAPHDFSKGAFPLGDAMGTAVMPAEALIAKCDAAAELAGRHDVVAERGTGFGSAIRVVSLCLGVRAGYGRAWQKKKPVFETEKGPRRAVLLEFSGSIYYFICF